MIDLSLIAGEAMVAAGGKDNGVRLPKHNVVTHNVFSDYGVWDKQSAAYHKALAPGNTFAYNVVFNCSRHGVNFQDSMGGEGLVHHNVLCENYIFCIKNEKLRIKKTQKRGTVYQSSTKTRNFVLKMMNSAASI